MCVFAREVMQCSAAMDILFLMDGSYSVGKGSFERSKHYAVKLCQALDIGPDKVCVFSDCLCRSLPLLLTSVNSALFQVRVGLIQFGSTPRLEFTLDAHTNKQELMKHMKKVSYRFVSSLRLNVRKLLVPNHVLWTLVGEGY